MNTFTGCVLRLVSVRFRRVPICVRIGEVEMKMRVAMKSPQVPGPICVCMYVYIK